MTFEQQYQSVLREILQTGCREVNQRTGQEVAALPGMTVRVDLEKEFPLLSLRKMSVKNPVAEMMWFISGQKDANIFLKDHTRIWDLFSEEDGTVETAYGYRWRHHFGRDQLEDLVTLLTKEPSSRHGVIVTWDPSDDGLLGPKKKNVPCPYTFTVNIIGGRLHLHSIVRSNDMILGFPTDVAGFSLLALILAQKLGVQPGIYTHSISNAHIYDNHYDAAEIMLNRVAKVVKPIHLPNNCYILAKRLDEGLFKALVNSLLDGYDPENAIKGLLIAV